MADVEEESALVLVTGGYIDYICAALYPFWNLAGYNLKIKIDLSALLRFIPNPGGVAVEVLL